jgi:hypothetical protein
MVLALAALLVFCVIYEAVWADGHNISSWYFFCSYLRLSGRLPSNTPDFPNHTIPFLFHTLSHKALSLSHSYASTFGLILFCSLNQIFLDSLFSAYRLLLGLTKIGKMKKAVVLEASPLVGCVLTFFLFFLIFKRLSEKGNNR